MSKTDSTPNDAWIEVVRQKVAGIRFGSVQITVHEGRVTQVESLEKTRFSPAKEPVTSSARIKTPEE